MCGIVAAIARRDIVPMLLEGLKRLEYRGYDSAGIAVLEADRPRAALRRLRSAGRVSELCTLAAAQGLSAPLGIAHTRWATHGAPSERNAHPHISAGIAVVHNGIIENHESIRAQLEAQGYRFDSDTDTEVIAHLIHAHRRRKPDLLEATRAGLRAGVARKHPHQRIRGDDGPKQPQCPERAKHGEWREPSSRAEGRGIKCRHFAG